MTSIKLFALLFLLASTVAHASLYRWVDENGKVHFSDKVPPAMSQKGHTSLNKNGIESSKVSSAEELKQMEEESKKKTQILAEMTDAKRAEAEQNRKDEQLLATYETREELISVFQKRLSLIDQGIGIMRARDENLTQKLTRLNQKYKQTKKGAPRQNLSMQIQSVQESLEDYQKALALNNTDKEAVTDKYRETLIRFDHLNKSIQ